MQVCSDSSIDHLLCMYAQYYYICVTIMSHFNCAAGMYHYNSDVSINNIILSGYKYEQYDYDCGASMNHISVRQVWTIIAVKHDRTIIAVMQE